MSSSRKTWNSSSSNFKVMPPYSGTTTLSPTLTFMGITCPSRVRPPGPTAKTVA
eukprot:CAMPEP_0206446978 /NCGR_PEP_ID=MMETSP0324_2-20121206/16490_1 /ASSEMBLY_ACC=CAM_ASM_000836 /TAXON_ID=2866 /ORGANISM="Crypthecodinium cohnii, Strain Seligo" /LENGTH=53 /DNA_ID=CAMNT_0053915617 /DNA_START=160 /DNA_END=321 /DNA_ORIENTATION=+